MKAVRKMLGFALTFELIMVLVVVGVVVPMAIGAANQYQRAREAKLAGQEQGAVAAALANYVAKNIVPLRKRLAGDGTAMVMCGSAACADPLHPTLAELRSAGYQVAADARLGGSYSLEVSTDTLGDVESRVWRTVAVTTDGAAAADINRAVQVADAAEEVDSRLAGNVGVSQLATPALISGPRGAWTRPNASGRAGMVLAKTSFNASTWGAYCAQGGDCSVNNLTAATGTVTQLQGQRMAYVNGQLTDLNASSVTATAGVTGNVTGNLTGTASNANRAASAASADMATVAGSASRLTGTVNCSQVIGSNQDLCNISTSGGTPGGSTCSNGATNPPLCNNNQPVPTPTPTPIPTPLPTPVPGCITTADYPIDPMSGQMLRDYPNRCGNFPSYACGRAGTYPAGTETFSNVDRCSTQRCYAVGPGGQGNWSWVVLSSSCS